MESLTKTFEVYFGKKAPALPKNIKEIIVSFAPWLEIISAFLALPALMAVFGIRAMMFSAPYGGYAMARAGFSFSIATIFLVLSFVLAILSIPGLFKRKISGWNLVYYSVLLNAVYSLLTMEIFSLIIGSMISLYILFQVKSYYK